MNIPRQYQKVREVNITPRELIEFEDRVKEAYENAEVKGPVHLSKNNETTLIELFQYIHPEDWVFSAWRNHYHALLHGVDKEKLFKWICEGRSMETGVFHEAYKYSQNYNLPLQFVVEDNNLSVHTPTDIAWGKRMNIPENVIYYNYKMSYPHHGTGKWVNF